MDVSEKDTCKRPAQTVHVETQDHASILSDIRGVTKASTCPEAMDSSGSSAILISSTDESEVVSSEAAPVNSSRLRAASCSSAKSALALASRRASRASSSFRRTASASTRAISHLTYKTEEKDGA